MKLIDKLIERKTNLLLVFPGLYFVTKRLALIDLLVAVELARDIDISRNLVNQPTKLSPKQKAVLDAVVQLDNFITHKLKTRNTKSHNQLKKSIVDYAKFFSININIHNITDVPFKTVLCTCHDELFNKVTTADLNDLTMIEPYLSEALELTAKKEAAQLQQLINGLKYQLTLHVQPDPLAKSTHLSSADKLSNVSLGSSNIDSVHHECSAGYDTICDQDALLISPEYDMLEDMQPSK